MVAVTGLMTVDTVFFHFIEGKFMTMLKQAVM
jgi:hypothetical protein